MNRRSLLKGTLAKTALLSAGAATALSPTPRQSRGPFYPDSLPLESDNDLVRVDGQDGLAKGEITDLTGDVLDSDGNPVQGALIEIWQCDANGRYLHRGDGGVRTRDSGFQGYGRFETGPEGRYRFRTIKPVPYPGRVPHIHFFHPGAGACAAGHPDVRGRRPGESRRLASWSGNGPGCARAALVVPFVPIESADAALAARFDLALA